MINHCIFRNPNDSKCCFFKCKDKNKNYCNLHINNDNIIYEIINNSIGIKQIKTVNDIYIIFKYIYDTPDIYIKEMIFKKILKTLFIKQWILRNKFYYLNQQNYDLLIQEIFKINLNTYLIEKNKEKSFVTNIQKFMKYICIRNHIYKSNVNYINETDPFTFDKLNEIPLKERFIFNEDNNYYCFKANEFKYFIRTNGDWNPYTKKKFNTKLLINLNYFIDYFNLNKNPNNQWETIEQAFTDVSIIIEKAGFYTNMQWFIKLTQKQIKNIIRLFHIININHLDYFNDLIHIIYEEIDTNEIYYLFAREVIKLFENSDSNFFLCCNFMKCLGVYSNDFYNSLPDWLSDIESPVIINNNNNLIYLINIIEN